MADGAGDRRLRAALVMAAMALLIAGVIGAFTVQPKKQTVIRPLAAPASASTTNPATTTTATTARSQGAARPAAPPAATPTTSGSAAATPTTAAPTTGSTAAPAGSTIGAISPTRLAHTGGLPPVLPAGALAAAALAGLALNRRANVTRAD